MANAKFFKAQTCTYEQTCSLNLLIFVSGISEGFPGSKKCYQYKPQPVTTGITGTGLTFQLAAEPPKLLTEHSADKNKKASTKAASQYTKYGGDFRLTSIRYNDERSVKLQ